MIWPKADSTLRPIDSIGDAKGWHKSDLCGVTAIASITGIHCTAVTNTVWRTRGNRKPVRGMSPFEVCNVLGVMGYRADAFYLVPPRLTLRHFWRERGDAPAVIAWTRGHFLALDPELCADTSTQGVADFVDANAYAGYAVKGYIEVREIP